MALRLELPGTPGRLPYGPARPAAPFARGLIDLSWTACDRSLHVNGPPRVHEHNGIARSYTAGSSQYSTRTNVQGIGSDATLLWWGYVDGTTGANRTLMAVNASGSTRYVQYVDTVGGIRVWAAGGTTQNGTATGVSATTGALVCYVARCTPTFRELSRNGSQIATNNTNVGTVTGINRVSIGADVVSGSPSGYLTGRWLLRAVWNRYITDAELAAVGKNPLRLIEPRRIWVPVSAPSSGTTIAVPQGSLTLTGNAPTVVATANQRIAVPAGALTLTGNAPTVTTTANQLITIPAGTLTLTGYAPTVIGGESVPDVAQNRGVPGRWYTLHKGREVYGSREEIEGLLRQMARDHAEEDERTESLGEQPEKRRIRVVQPGRAQIKPAPKAEATQVSLPVSVAEQTGYSPADAQAIYAAAYRNHRRREEVAARKLAAAQRIEAEEREAIAQALGALTKRLAAKPATMDDLRALEARILRKLKQ